MRLIFHGHTRSHITPINASNLGQRCRGRHGNTGCFVHHGSWTEKNGVLTIQFNPIIYLNRTLTGQSRSEVLRHEQRHYRDFRQQATWLYNNLVRSIQRHQDPQMDARWAWFLYDLCTDSAVYHRQIGATVEICMQPAGHRP